MHGRKRTALKNKEEEKLEKAKKLTNMISILGQNKKKKLYDATNFEMSDYIIKKFPLVQTVWNYRREYFEFQKGILQSKKENDKSAEKAKDNALKISVLEETEKEMEEKKLEKTEEELEEMSEEKLEKNRKCENWTMQELKEQINKENMMVKHMLTKFKKSYELWFHKLWLIKFSLKSNFMTVHDLFQELEFCKSCLSFDDRNFHCWNYRTYILSCIHICLRGCLKKDNVEKEVVVDKKSDMEKETDVDETCVSDAKECVVEEKKEVSFDVFQENFELSKELIEKNFSNFSAWFLKYSLKESIFNLKEELELIKNAMFTDPYDQSLWQYYNWFLFCRGNSKEQIWCTFLKKKEIYLFFPKLVRLNIPKCKCYDENGTEIQGSWEKQIITCDSENTNVESFVYVFKIDQHIELEKLKHIRFVLYYLKYNIYHPNEVNYEQSILKDMFKKNENNCKENKHEYIIHHEIDLSRFSKNTGFQFLLYLKQKEKPIHVTLCPPKDVNEHFKLYECINSSMKSCNLGTNIDFQLLEQELEQINELLVLEDTCKFALLNKFAILKVMEKYDEAFEVLNNLKKIDRFRIEYYKQEELELRIKKKVQEYYLQLKEVNNPVLDLRNLHIKDITYPVMLEAFFIQRINLANNYLTESIIGKCTLNFLYNLKELTLKNNKIKDFSLFMKNIYNLKFLEKLDVSENILVSLDENLETYDFVVLPLLREINISNSNFSFLLQDKFSEIQHVNSYKVSREDNMLVWLLASTNRNGHKFPFSSFIDVSR